MDEKFRLADNARTQKKKPAGRLDPRTKLLYWLTALTVVSSVSNPLVYAVSAAVFAMILFDGFAALSLCGAGIFSLLLFMDMLFPDTVMSFIAVYFPRVLSAGMVFCTLIGRDEAARTVAALRKCHIPERIIMICSVVFRFFPTLSEDMNTSRLKVRDIITVTLLTLINVVIFFVSSFLYALPITIVLMPIFFSLLEGVVYFIIGTKIKKPGAMMIYSFVRGILGGYLPYIGLYLLSGVIAEIIMKKTGYGNLKGLTASYIITQVLAGIGSTIYPYAIAAKSMAENPTSDGRSEAILSASELLVSWGAPLLLAGIIVTAFIGAMIGSKIVKKHIVADRTEDGN